MTRQARVRRITVLPPLPPRAHVLRQRSALPFPLGRPGCSIHAWGRHALWHGLRGTVSPGDEALVPAWHHGSEVEILAKLGLRCRFYDCGPGLEPDQAELESLLSESTRVLHLTHYLGFPLDGERWRNWADERNLILVEDAAQAWLASYRGRPVGSFGHVSVFCLYKSFGLPDGAACYIGSGQPATTATPTRRAASLLARRRLAWLAQRLPLLPSEAPTAEGRSHEEDIAIGDPDLPVAAGTARLLSRACDPRAAEQRRENHARLMDELRGVVAQGFDRVEHGAVPFVFPIRVADKHTALQHLRRRGILAVDFWSQPHRLLEPGRFAGAERRRSETIALPVHQELRAADIDRVAIAAKEATAL